SALLRRLAILALAIATAAGAGLFFNRFDEHLATTRRGWFRKKKKAAVVLDIVEPNRGGEITQISGGSMSIPRITTGANFARMVRSELLLTMNGVNRWWMIVSAG